MSLARITAKIPASGEIYIFGQVFPVEQFTLSNIFVIYQKKNEIVSASEHYEGKGGEYSCEKKCYDVIEISKTDITIRSLITWWKLSD